LEQAIQAFLTDLKYGQGRASNTLVAYRTDLVQFAKVVADKTGESTAIGEFTVEHVDAYVDWLEARKYKASTVARKMAVIRSFIRFASADDRSRADSLLAQLKPPLAEASRETRILTRAEVTTLLAAPLERRRVRDLRDAAILAVLYVTGIRVAEAVELRTYDVDMVSGVLRASGERTEKPLDVAYGPLRAYLVDARPQLISGKDPGTLFLNQRGGGLSRQGLWLVVKRWANAVALDGRISPHTLRRSRAEHMLEDGRRKRDVQRFLGLTSPNTLHSKPASLAGGEDESTDE
jgi:integrase/recombinase XerD